jgi:hypothetical protein
MNDVSMKTMVIVRAGPKGTGSRAGVNMKMSHSAQETPQTMAIVFLATSCSLAWGLGVLSAVAPDELGELAVKVDQPPHGL